MVFHIGKLSRILGLEAVHHTFDKRAIGAGRIGKTLDEDTLSVTLFQIGDPVAKEEPSGSVFHDLLFVKDYCLEDSLLVGR